MLSNKQMQTNLKYYLGYYTGAIDGIVGVKTKAAVKAFQRDNKLTVDGKYGPITDAKLIEKVKYCQKRLGVSEDGRIGNITIGAVKTFQRKNGLAVTGVINKDTLTKLQTLVGSTVNWGSVKYFKKAEFKCDCNGAFCNGYPAEISPVLVALLDRARAHFGKPMKITSGLRCKKRNAQLSGSIANSKHLSGKAADVWIIGAAGNNNELVKWFKSQSEVSYCYTGFGAVHVDVK